MRYALQWVMFICFCAVNAWLWLGAGGEQPRRETQITVQSGQPESSAASSAPINTSESFNHPQPPTLESANPAPGLERLADLLIAGEYEQSVDLYSILYNQADDEQAEQQRAILMFYVNTQLEKGRTENAIELLAHYTNTFYEDVEALQIMASALHESGEYLKSINVLFSALTVAYQFENISQLQKQLNMAVNGEVTRLKRQDATLTQLTDFYRGLIDRDPLYPPFKLGLAKMLAKDGQTTEAVSLVRDLVNDPEYMSQAEQILSVAKQVMESDHLESIPLQQVGNNYSVTAIVNGRSDVVLLVDTGASLTTIRPEVLKRSGISVAQRERTARFVTANGVIHAPIVRLQSLSVGEQTIDDLEVGSVSLQGLDGIDGLLGMNYLQNFKFTISQQENKIHLFR